MRTPPVSRVLRVGSRLAEGQTVDGGVGEAINVVYTQGIINLKVIKGGGKVCMSVR